MRRVQRRSWTLAFVLGIVSLGIAAGAAAAAPNQEVATLSGGGAGVEFRPVVDYEKLVLTVSGPGEMMFRREFAAGVPVAFSAFTEAGQVLPDGDYTYELRAAPRLSADVRRKLAEARQRGNERAVLAELRRAGQLPKGGVQSGSFTMANGSFVVSGLAEETGPRAAKEAVRAVTAADQVIPDDLIVQGSECVGFDCVNGEAFSFDTIRLKENSTRITFIDTSTIAGLPNQDWQLRANDASGAGVFTIDYLGTGAVDGDTPSTTPFKVEAAAVNNSIYVDSTGRVGLRTATPVLDLHINTANTPAIRLEQNNSGGFTAQTWDVAGNESSFFVRDVTGGSTLPFRVRPGAPTSSIDISADGDVGIGTASPDFQLHVFDTETSDANIGVGPDPGGLTGVNFGHGGASFGRGAGFFNAKDTGATAPNPSVRFLTSTIQRMIIDNEGNIGFGSNVAGFNPADPLVHQNTNARLTGGIWTDGSSRAIKHDIRPLEAGEALAAFARLEPVSYRPNDKPEEVVLGFIAEDVPELVAFNDRKSLSPMDMVAVLTKVVQEQQRAVAELERQIEELRGRLTAGEAKP